MPKVLPKEKEDRLLRLWLLATRDNPNRAIESVYNDIYLEEFEGRKHAYRRYVSPAWLKKDKRSLSWLTQRAAKKWKGLKLPQEPGETLVKPWDDNWGDDPARIRTLSVLFDLATEVVEYVRAYSQPVELQFPLRFVGFPTSVCDWACKLSAFFDLQLKCECCVLLHFAYVFAADEQYATTFNEPMSFAHESFKMLMRWHKRNQEPDLTQRIFESEGVVSIPIWEQSNEEDMIWAVASHLSQGPWVSPPLDMGEATMETVNKEYETTYQAN